MATKSEEGTNGAVSYRQLLMAQYDAYMKVAVRKHSLSHEMFRTKAASMSNEELSSAVTILRDLAHLPPE